MPRLIRGRPALDKAARSTGYDEKNASVRTASSTTKSIPVWRNMRYQCSDYLLKGSLFEAASLLTNDLAGDAATSISQLS